MSNIKVIYDCTTKTTSYVPLSAKEIKEREEAAKRYAEEQAVKELEATQVSEELETPVEE